MNKLKLFNDMVLIKPIEEQEGPIAMPDVSKEAPQTGEIVELGPKAKEGLEIGMKVLYRRWGGDEIKVGINKLILLTDEDILAGIE